MLTLILVLRGDGSEQRVLIMSFIMDPHTPSLAYREPGVDLTAVQPATL